jgi:hypothetical protein
MAHWNYGRSQRGQPRIDRRDATVYRDGKRWTAAWEIDGDKLVISSAWGSRRAPLGNRDALDAQKDLARQLLETMIADRT